MIDICTIWKKNKKNNEMKSMQKDSVLNFEKTKAVMYSMPIISGV